MYVIGATQSDCPTDKPCFCETAPVGATPPLPSYPSFVQAERVIVEPTNRQPGWVLHNFSKIACHHASARLPPNAAKIDETTIDCLGAADFAAFTVVRRVPQRRPRFACPGAPRALRPS